MPPIRYRAPLPVRFKVPGSVVVPLDAPDLMMGKSIVASHPGRITADHIEETRKSLRKYLGKKTDFMVNIHATYAVTRKPEGTKMGQGKGSIHHFVSRCPAGRVMFNVPRIASLPGVAPNFEAFRMATGHFHIPVHFREQTNQFKPVKPTRKMWFGGGHLD